MKKILSVVVALCMILAYSTALASFAGSKATELNTEGYCVWHDNYIEVFFPNEEVAQKAAAYTFTGIAISVNNELQWNGGDPLQLSGNLSVTGTKGVFKLHAGHNASVKDVMTGAKTCWSKSFPTWAEEKHGNITLRIEHEGNPYYIYYLPIYGEGEFDNAVHLTDAYFSTDNRIAMVFNRAVGNVYGQDHSNPWLNHTTRFTAVRIVNNTTDWNLIWDNDIPMQWCVGVDGYWANNILYSTVLGAGSVPGGAQGPYASYTTFDSIKSLVKPGGKFDGCVVAFCIEELNAEGGNPGTVAGDGYINCFFDNSIAGTEANVVKTDCLKANRVVADQLDGAYVTMYDPNSDEYFNPVSITGARVVETAEGGANDYLVVDFNRPFDKFQPPKGYWPAVTITKDPSKAFDYELAWSCSPAYGEYVGAIGGFANIPLKVGACSDAAKELSTTGKNTTNINDILSLVKEGGVYEGYYVTVRIEETECAQGNGHLDIFCDAMNDFAANIKSNTTPLAGANDVSVFTICEPVSKTTTVFDASISAEIVSLANDGNDDLYVVFSEPVQAPNGNMLALVAKGWPAGGNLRYTRRVEFTDATAVSDTVWKFTKAGHKGWTIGTSQDIGNDMWSEGHYGEFPHPVDGNVGASWSFMLFGDVKSKDGTKTMPVDSSRPIQNNNLNDTPVYGYVLKEGTKANNTEYHATVQVREVSSVDAMNYAFVNAYRVSNEANWTYLQFSEPVTLGDDFALKIYTRSAWGAGLTDFVFVKKIATDMVEKVDDVGCLYRVANKAYYDANCCASAFDPTTNGFFYQNHSFECKLAITGTVTTKSGRALLYTDENCTTDNYSGRFHDDMSGTKFMNGIDLTYRYTTVSTVDDIPTSTVVLAPLTVSFKDSYSTDGKVDFLYINAAVPAEGTYGILFAENEFANEASLKLKKDGGNPLFTKICDKYDAVLQGGCYDDAEISATNVGGEIGDKLIALKWKNMPAYDKFAVRMYKVLDNGTVVYGPVSTVSLTDGGCLLPID